MSLFYFLGRLPTKMGTVLFAIFPKMQEMPLLSLAQYLLLSNMYCLFINIVVQNRVSNLVELHHKYLSTRGIGANFTTEFSEIKEKFSFNGLYLVFDLFFLCIPVVFHENEITSKEPRSIWIPHVRIRVKLRLSISYNIASP